MIATLDALAEIKRIKAEQKDENILLECRKCNEPCKQFMVKGLTKLFCGKHEIELTIMEEN